MNEPGTGASRIRPGRMYAWTDGTSSSVRPPRPPHSPPDRAAAQEAYPTRPVTFVNPFPPGGAVDVVARPLAAVLEPLLKQPVVIETKAGAAGQVGAQFAASAKPDGYTLLMHIVVDLGLRRGRQAVRPAGEVHARRLHSDRALHRRSDGARRQRPAALQDAEGVRRRRQEAAERIDLQLVRPLRRAAPADGAVHAKRRHPDAAPADRRRRAGADGDPRQQLAGAGVVDRGGQRADEGRQAACRSPASARKRAPALPDVPTHEGARLRRRVLSLGRPVRAQGHAGAGHRDLARRIARRRRRTRSSSRR